MGCILTILTAATALAAATYSASPKDSLTNETRTDAIRSILRCLNEEYIYPEVAEKMERSVLAKSAQGVYDRISEPHALADRLTLDLQDVSHDLHIRVHYSPEKLPKDPGTEFRLTPEMKAQMSRHMRRDNFGMGKAEVLKGNVGYLQFDYLAPLEVAADTYRAGMATIANSDALILDLRSCRGSMSPQTIPMLCSYFFAKPTHLNTIRWRKGNRTEEFWTKEKVEGQKYLDKPIYVLVSGSTFSGAEEMAYDLKNLKRAVIIGDTTGGGANPGGTRRANDHFGVFVPFGQVINPITKTNWEGVGVTPNVPVPAITALRTAHLTALKELSRTATEPEWRQALAAISQDVEQEPSPFRTVNFRLEGHPDAKEVTVAGTFNFWASRPTRLRRDGNAWIGTAQVAAGRTLYKFVVDGNWIPDPANPKKARPTPDSDSVVLIP